MPCYIESCSRNREYLMKYDLAYDEERDLIVGHVHDGLDASLALKMSSDLANLIRTHGCYRLLNDLRDAEITSSTLEIYAMPRAIAKFKEANRCKRALVVSGRLDNYRFLETVSLNIGQQLRIFTDIETAVDWLNTDEEVPDDPDRTDRI